MDVGGAVATERVLLEHIQKSKIGPVIGFRFLHFSTPQSRNIEITCKHRVYCRSTNDLARTRIVTLTGASSFDTRRISRFFMAEDRKDA